ncbi:MAG TPA: DUF4390 domain-containing protein [Vicinamibacterales bacterium]|jgi:hypothetical protein
MRTRLLVSIGIAWMAAATIAFAAAQTIQVTPLAREGRVYVSFKLAEGLTDEVSEAIHSGLTITFSYDVDLKRSAAVWFDRTIASTTVSASVKYDTLTRRYSVTRAYDGRIGSAESTESEDVVRGWLTSFDRLPLFSTDGLEPNAEYYLRVRVRTTPRFALLFFWPWGDRHDVAGMARFTFIP